MSSKKKRVLIAEDSAVIQDIVFLFLTKDGHEVTLAKDGNEALQNLLDSEYDVALLDFHLPEFSGLEVIRRFINAAGDRKMPRLLAMTGDTKGFMAEGKDCELFEQVFPKPIDIEKLIKIIASEESIARPIQAPTQNSNDAQKEKKNWFANLNLWIVSYPDDFNNNGQKNIQMRLELDGAPDAVVITSPPSTAGLDMLKQLPYCHLCPIIDMSGSFGSRSEKSQKNETIKDEDIKILTTEYAQRRDHIHPDFGQPENGDERLLSRIYVIGKPLTPRYAPNYFKTIEYNSLDDPEDIENYASSLHGNGLVEKEFFDRVQVCPRCKGSRLNPREVCMSCQSANLSEETYIHHFRCAYQGPESLFQQRDRLICPKCSREVRNFGGDYDRPGDVLLCNSCQEWMTDPNISFICLDCKQISTGVQIETRDIFSYLLTSKGRDVVENGRIDNSSMSSLFKFSNVPIPIISHLNKFAAQKTDGDISFSFAVINYSNLMELGRTEGAGMVERTRKMIFQRIIEILKPDSSAPGSQMADYFMFDNYLSVDLEPLLNGAIQKISTEISIDLNLTTEIYTPSDIF